MVKAVLRGGVIYPSGPLPSEWHDGVELQVEKVEPQGANGCDTIDQWYTTLESLCAAADPEEDRQLGDALAQAREQSKALVRRQMGLAE